MMALLSDHIGRIVMCTLTTASSTPVTADTTGTVVPIQGMESVLFLTTLVTVPTTDGGASDGSVYVRIQYSSTGEASDAVTSNAGFSCTDCIVTISSATTAGSILPLEINLSRKNLQESAGVLVVETGGDSVSVVRVIAIPNPGTSRMPITQTVATVVGDD